MEQELLHRVEAFTGASGRIKDRFIDATMEDQASALGSQEEHADAAISPQRSIQCIYKVVNGHKVPEKLAGPLRNVESMFAGTRDAASQPIARWPLDVELMYPPPKHIYWSPPFREPFQEASAPPAQAPKADRDASAAATAKKMGKVVFSLPNVRTRWFLPERVQTCDNEEREIKIESQFQPKDTTDTTLTFESRFESGNLLKAVKIDDYEYNLVLRTDLYTNRHTQWYYFRVGNTRRGFKYKFNIINLLKSDSLYNRGMQPVMYSEAKAREGQGWVRAGSDIQYFRNNIRQANQTKFFNTLTWSIVFDEDDDTVFFAHCYPYTYTDLQTYLTELMQDDERSKSVRLRVLCRTLAGNICDLLTVTNFGVTQHEMAARKGVVITARVHPGETNGSLMMKGFIDFITGSSEDARILRDNFVFKIVPMMNPDGVIVGNYRCSLAGVDLNRTYKHTIRDLYPTIYATKMMMQRLARDREIAVYCDLHGHSKKQNVFIYGCNNRLSPALLLRERIFPMMLSLNGSSKFSYKGSKFSVQKSKESTGRVVTWRELNIVNSFTMEATFCGSTMGTDKNFQFNCRDFEMMGDIFFDTLLDYCDPDRSKVDYVYSKIKADALSRMKRPNATIEELAFASEESESDSDASDSSSSGGETEAAAARFKLMQNSKTVDDLAVDVSERAKLKSRRIKSRVQSAANLRMEDPERDVRSVLPGRGSHAAGSADEDEFEIIRGLTPAEEPDYKALAKAERRHKKKLLKQHKDKDLGAKYATLSNNGIPTFSQDRIQARAKRRAKQDEDEGRSGDGSGKTRGDSSTSRDRSSRKSSALSTGSRQDSAAMQRKPSMSATRPPPPPPPEPVVASTLQIEFRVGPPGKEKKDKREDDRERDRHRAKDEERGRERDRDGSRKGDEEREKEKVRDKDKDREAASLRAIKEDMIASQFFNAHDSSAGLQGHFQEGSRNASALEEGFMQMGLGLPPAVEINLELLQRNLFQQSAERGGAGAASLQRPSSPPIDQKVPTVSTISMELDFGTPEGPGAITKKHNGSRSPQLRAKIPKPQPKPGQHLHGDKHQLSSKSAPFVLESADCESSGGEEFDSEDAGEEHLRAGSTRRAQKFCSCATQLPPISRTPTIKAVSVLKGSDRLSAACHVCHGIRTDASPSEIRLSSAERVQSDLRNHQLLQGTQGRDSARRLPGEQPLNMLRSLQSALGDSRTAQVKRSPRR